MAAYLPVVGVDSLTCISVFKELDAQNFFHNKFHFMPLHVSSTCAHHIYRCDGTRGCVMQF